MISQTAAAYPPATTADADLPAQRLWTQVPATALEPALLPGSRMPAPGPALAGGAAASQTASGRCGQSPARPGTTCAPPACLIFAASPEEASELRQRVVTQQNFFCRRQCATGRGAMKRPRSRAAARHATAAPPAAQAIRRVLDRERKWRLRGTFQGRCAREQEYQAARARRRREQPTLPPRHRRHGRRLLTKPTSRAGRRSMA